MTPQERLKEIERVLSDYRFSSNHDTQLMAMDKALRLAREGGDDLNSALMAYELIAKTQDMPEGVTVEEWCWKQDRIIREYLEPPQ